MSDGSPADTAGQGCNCEAVGSSLGAALVSNTAVICVGGEAHPTELGCSSGRHLFCSA